jgi:putative transcriptional regulator
MPIIVNLDVMLARRKMRLNELADLVGITAQNLSVLKTGRARAIRFATLDKLCDALDCQPGDLFAFERPTRSLPSQTVELAARRKLRRTGS